MHPVTFLLMTFLVSRYSTMAFVRHWVTSRQVCCRGPISSKFATIPKNVQLIGPSSKTVKNDMSRNDNEIWVLQFDGGSRGNPDYLIINAQQLIYLKDYNQIINVFIASFLIISISVRQPRSCRVWQRPLQVSSYHRFRQSSHK